MATVYDDMIMMTYTSRLTAQVGSTFVTCTGWTFAITASWWQQHKHCSRV